MLSATDSFLIVVCFCSSMGWCAGRNPSFVQRWHSANRATRASCSSSQALICPYTLQDSRFTASHPASSAN